MSDDSNRVGQLSAVKQALLRIEKMQTKLEAAERVLSEPIAVIGIGCRKNNANACGYRN